MQLGGWLDPKHLLSAFGLAGLAVIVFAESGLLIGLFPPGDSLLFTAGILAAAAGDSFGYAFGKRAGPALYRRDDARLFRRRQLQRALWGAEILIHQAATA